MFLHGLDKTFIQGFSLFRPGRRGIPRPAPLATIPIEGELRNNKHGSTGVEEGTIHFPCRIFKNPQVDYFVNQPVQIRLLIISMDTEQKDQTVTNDPDLFLIN